MIPFKRLAMALACSERDLSDPRDCRAYLRSQFAGREISPTIMQAIREEARDIRSALDARLAASLPNYRPIAA